MRALFLLALVSLTASADDHRGRFERFCSRTDQGRTNRGFLCDSLAFFEAFPASGAGTTTACSTTAPTGAKGEALTFARASTATCTKTAAGGLVSSGIADGDLVELSNNVARVEYDASGTLGLLTEGGRTNSLLRFIDFGNATWADVGTPTLTGSQASPFTGTYATSAVLFNDNDGAAFEGRSQTVTVTAAAVYTAHCYVKAGTATSARIVLDGTAATVTGLSSSTWSILEVTDASSSGVAIVAEVDVGSTAATTGTVIFGGCQVEAGSYRTSIIPTVAATATRSSEVGARFPLSGITTTMSMASTVWTIFNMATTGPQWLSLETTYGEASPKALGYSNAGFANTFVNGAGLFSTGVGWTSGSHRMSMDTGRNARFDATTTTTAAVTLSAPPTVVVLGGNGAAGLPCDCIQSRVQVDPSETRAR